MTKHTLIQATGLTKSFGDLQVLRGLDLHIDCGEVVGLLGTNGAGKTTAINIITGLLEPDGGDMGPGGPAGNRGWSSMIGVAPQDTALYPRLSCFENIAFFGRLYGLSGKNLKDHVATTIELLHLDQYRDTRVATLSGGTRRRLNLAVAMVHDPALLILDEPTAGLDIEARYSLWEVIPRLRDSGTSVLLTTHLLDEAAALCDRIAVLHEGRIACSGTVEELCSAIPAAQVADIQSDDEAALSRRAVELGLSMRRRGGRLALLLPTATSLETLVDSLSGTSISSISLRPVGLEDVFFDVTKADPGRTEIHDLANSTDGPISPLSAARSAAI